MDSIETLDPLNEYTTDRFEQNRDESILVEEQSKEDIQTPAVQASIEQQDQKQTINAFQYTGKGSFIDTIF